MPKASRINDTIAHSNALLGLIGGLVVGAVIGAAVVATGGAAAIVFAAAAGAATGAGIGEAIGHAIMNNAGEIATGAKRTKISHRLAARAVRDKVDCHAEQVIAQGSRTVYIEDFPVSRIGDKTQCDGTISSGSANVGIGREPGTYVNISSKEIPLALRFAVEVLGNLSVLRRKKSHRSDSNVAGGGEHGTGPHHQPGGSDGSSPKDHNSTPHVVPVAAHSNKPTSMSSETKQKILYGERVSNPNSPNGLSNRIVGAHSPKVKDHPNFAVETISNNADGTTTVKMVTQLPDGNLSKIKKSTLAPDAWSDGKIIEATEKVGDGPIVATNPSDMSTLHMDVVDGVEWQVIKDANGEVIASYPTGGDGVIPPNFK